MTRWRELERTYCVRSTSARNTDTWAFFRTPFSTTFCWRIFSNQRESVVVGPLVPQGPIFVKNSKSTSSPNFSINPQPDDEDDTAVIYYRPARKESSAVHLCSHVSCANTRETAARIVLVDEIFRAITRQVQYMAMHCTPKMKELNLSTNTWQN